MYWLIYQVDGYKVTGPFKTYAEIKRAVKLMGLDWYSVVRGSTASEVFDKYLTKVG